MHLTCGKVTTPFILALLLQACAAPATSPHPGTAAGNASLSTQTTAGSTGDVPELELNLPPPEQCVCDAAGGPDYMFFEKGYRALLDGEYEEAMEHFQRYQRLETSPRTDLEAGIAIAYLQTLPRSPYYEPQTARASFKVLREQNAKKLKVHEYTRLMRQALLNMLALQRDMDKLEASNTALTEDLEKREEALKRLRDLTLNQKKAAPP